MARFGCLLSHRNRASSFVFPMRLNTATNTAQKYEVPVTRKRARAHVKIEVEEETKAEDRTIKNVKTIQIEDESEKKVLSKKIRKKSDQLSNAVPDNWEYIYTGIKEYRKRVTAPVDTMGCERLADEPSETVTAEVLNIRFDANSILETY